MLVASGEGSGTGRRKCRMSLPFANDADTMLLIEASNRSIEVERATAQLIHVIEALRLPVDYVGTVLGITELGLDPATAQAKTKRVSESINALADQVARIRRPEQRQHEIRARTDAPNTERLAEIRFMEGDVRCRANVDKATQTTNGVQPNSRKRVAGTGTIALEAVIQKNNGALEVMEEVRHALPDGSGNIVAIFLCDRVQNVVAQLDIDCPDNAIALFQRIIRALRMVIKGR